jgi:hypothetical protein
MLTIRMPEEISIDTIDFLLKQSDNIQIANSNNRVDILLDFSNIKYLLPEGALSIICFCNYLRSNIIKPNNIFFHLNSPIDSVYRYLTYLGFYSQMSQKADITEIQNVVHFESELKYKRNEQKKTIQYSKDSFPKPIILPIETIPMQMDSISGKDFENMIGVFVNHTIDSFSELFNNKHYNFNGEDQHDFLLSNVELYKNIFEHSQSWGIGTIHARPNFGTSVCYFDIGIGFLGSVKKFDTDIDAINWALIDGHSSKSGADNDGFGLTIVQDFVLKRKGVLKIRSGTCLLELKEKSKTSKTVTYFPGVQICYFIPV